MATKKGFEHIEKLGNERGFMWDHLAIYRHAEVVDGGKCRTLARVVRIVDVRTGEGIDIHRIDGADGFHTYKARVSQLEDSE